MGSRAGSSPYTYPDPESRSVTDPLSITRIYRGLRRVDCRVSRELPEEIPDSEEDLENLSDTEEKVSDSECEAGSFQSQETVIVPGGTKLTPKPQQHWNLHRRGINCNGRLASEDPRYAGTEDMEEEATQPSTQPFLDPRRQGRNASLSLEDESDIICILHPCSPAAYQAVELVASSTPQHILQNEGLSCNLQDDIEDELCECPTRPEGVLQEDAVDDLNVKINGPADLLDDLHPMLVDNAPSRKDNITRDIALRISSRVKDPCMGFTFGRNPQRCDLVIGARYVQRHISNMHFRIFLNDQGVIMCEDTSTNGTYVENVLLTDRINAEVEGNVCKGKPNTSPPKRTLMLTQGSVIQLITKNSVEEIKFIVGIPTRDHAGDKYSRNLEEYLAYIAQARRQAAAHSEAKHGNKAMPAPLVREMANNSRDWAKLTKVPIAPLRNGPLAGSMPSNIAAASERYKFGMRWNGGKTYNVVGVIGKGAFAVVYQLATKSEGKVYAVKELEKRRFMKNGVLDHKVDNELKIMKSLDHPHIVKYVDYEDVPNYLYIVMEFVPRGDLSTYLSNTAYMTEYQCRIVARQMCHALDYLHKCGITHRDIKPDNILIASVNPLVIKLSDFGLSKVVKDQETFLKTFCGTLLYCAPEVYPDYDRCKQKLPRKRRRGNEPPPKTSPYNQAVDIWSLAAVIYHLLCGKPPFTGSAEDKGVLMLEAIMENKLSFKPLSNNGVTSDAVDFLSKMLRIEPKERPLASQCLEHPWLSGQTAVIGSDKQPDQPIPSLNDIQEEDEGLDASQLSLIDNYTNRPTDDSGDEEEVEDLEVDELADVRQSKRFKFDDDSRLHGEGEMSSSGEVSYPFLPIMGTEPSGATASRPQQANRLFGEIGASALRSSGVLGYDANVALDMPVDEDVGVEGSTGHLANETEDSHLIAQPHHHYPHTIPVPPHTSLASSLFGAEVQIGELNMASPESGVSAPSVPTAPATPRTPKSRQVSPSMSARTGSKRSSQAIHSASDGNTPKRSRFDRSISPSNPMYYYDELDPTTHNLEYASKASGRDFVSEYRTRQGALATTRASSMVDDKTFDNSIPKEVGALDQVPSESNAAQISRDFYYSSVVADASSSTTSKSVEAGAMSPVTADAEIKDFVKPLPRLGKLSSVAGSLRDIAFYLEQRITSWGRDPAVNTYAYPDPADTRVSRNAIDILFWRPGIEREIEQGADWLQIKDVWAIITTRSSSHIRINGVKLGKGRSDGWYYGKLMTGDIITVCEQGKDFLKFKCEFYHGVSQDVRLAGETFVVEKETEKFQQCMSRRSSVTAEEIARASNVVQGSTAAAGTGTIVTAAAAAGGSAS